jgi:hypothetical protein
MKTFATMQDDRLAEILAEFGRLRIRQFRGLVIKPNQSETIGQETPPRGERVALEHPLAALAGGASLPEAALARPGLSVAIHDSHVS